MTLWPKQHFTILATDVHAVLTSYYLKEYMEYLNMMKRNGLPVRKSKHFDI